MTELNTIKNNIKKEVLENNLELTFFDTNSMIKKYDYLVCSVNSLSKKYNYSSYNINAAFKLLYLETDSDLKFELFKSRNGVKIMSIKPNDIDISKDGLMDFYKASSLTKEEICFMSAPFKNNITTSQLIDILTLYAIIKNKVNKSDIAFYCISSKESLYELVKEKFTFEQVVEIYNLIKQFGYSFNKNNVLHWKTANPILNITKEEIDNYFTVIDVDNKDSSLENSISPKSEIENTLDDNVTFTRYDAISFIAKELGVSLGEDESKKKLNEMIAITNELILNFDELEDWEKLKNWEKFKQDWLFIMEVAIRDRD